MVGKTFFESAALVFEGTLTLALSMSTWRGDKRGAVG
jgi:hypothetical protein